MKLKVIAVTGTPGTGKTTFGRTLAESLGAELVDLNDLIARKKIYRADREGTKVASLDRMKREFTIVLKSKKGEVVVEGLLSHFLPKRSLTHVVVLRTKPSVLKARLKTRKFGEKKLRENVEAEALDIILWEAVKTHGRRKVYEIDTTRRTPKTSVKLFLDALGGKAKLKPGKVSWLEEFYKIE